MERLTKQNGQRCTYYLACFGPEEDHEGGISHKCDYCKEELARSDKLATYEDMEEQGKIQLMDCTGCIHKGNRSFCLNCKRGGFRDYYLTE